MIGCMQDPIHHAEGDVATHTRMVCEALISSAEWQQLERQDQLTAFLACALHDVAKPQCTKVESDGRISSKDHGIKGAQIVRQILWRGQDFIDKPAPLALREAVSYMVRASSTPFWLFDKADPSYTVIRASQSVRLDLLAMLSEADARGRICSDLADLLSRVNLFREYASEKLCLNMPYQFPSAHTRFNYFRKRPEQKDNANPAREVFDDTRFEVTIMSGLPGAGKDSWVKKNAGSLPEISLDTIRANKGISADKDQSEVIRAARQEARELMRKEKSFVFNGTNVSRFIRDPLISFFREYGARIKIVYVEPSSFKELLKRNRNRPEPVPEKVILKLADKLEVPDLTEAHELVWVVND